MHTPHLLLFPNQLFDISIIQRVNPIRITFIEDDAFYGRKTMELNPLRLVYMRGLHKAYLKMLRTHFTMVAYHTIDAKRPFDYKGLVNATYFDPCDIALEAKLSAFERLDSPSFLLSRADIESYASERDGKRLQHSHFYTFVKSKLHILEDVKNLDTLNRKPFTKNVPIPASVYVTKYTSPTRWTEPIKRYNANIDVNYLTKLPFCHADVDHWTARFFKTRFEHYGSYQDVIYDKNPMFYHSGLSIYLNNGMIVPAKIVKIAAKYKKIVHSYEGFIRQIIGWREYARYYYHTILPSIYRQNAFDLTVTRLPHNWGDDIPIVKKAKEYAQRYGYLNHIQRLMVVSNYMTLSSYHPDVVYKWFFEFALDSYDWVMIFNVYGMGTYADNGHAMRKPYICSSKYLLRMSNEERGTWEAKWDALYRAFIEKHADVLKHTVLANLI